MQDPYSVLGLGRDASMEDVTAAYRKLAKKYHPDLNPGDQAAEEKMRQVNVAYEQIKTGKTGGAKYERADGSYGHREQPGQGQRGYRGEDPFGGFGFGFGGFEDLFGEMFGGAWQGQQQQQQAFRERPGDTPMERQAKTYLRAGQYRDAERVLAQMPRKTAQWYYLSAQTSAGLGNRVTALSHAREAVRLEPNMLEYRQLLDRLQRGSAAYRQAGQQRGYNMQTFGRGLMGLMMAQMFCFFCCRPC